MSRPGNAIDDATALLIEQRIDQAFAFMYDVIDDPDVLEEIPDGSRLEFRDIDCQGIRLRLTAYPSPDRAGWWIARITGPAEIAAAARSLASKWESPPTSPAGGPTAEAALDTLAEKLRGADFPNQNVRRAVGG
jgi:hypothetical protein